MYHEFFGLKQAPFKITPDTRLFFPGGSRGEILEALVYTITSGEGIVKVVGEVGSGKTMLCRMLAVRIPPGQIEIVYLPNPSLTAEDIVHAIALELGLEVNPVASRAHVMQALHECLLRRHAENRRVVVFVEEAQAMPLATLEEIRLLSNLETQQDKLLQIVLFGQPELDRNLNMKSIRQLKERITHNFHLPPLSIEDIQQYVQFRLHAVGYRGPDMFSRAAYKQIAQASQGLTRRVNIIADKCLLAAFAENSHNVTRKHATKAIADSEIARIGLRLMPAHWAAAGVGMVLIGGLVFLGIRDTGSGSAEPSAAADSVDALAATDPPSGAARPSSDGKTDTSSTQSSAASATPPSVPTPAVEVAVAAGSTATSAGQVDRTAGESHSTAEVPPAQASATLEAVQPVDGGEVAKEPAAAVAAEPSVAVATASIDTGATTQRADSIDQEELVVVQDDSDAEPIPGEAQAPATQSGSSAETSVAAGDDSTQVVALLEPSESSASGTAADPAKTTQAAPVQGALTAPSLLAQRLEAAERWLADANPAHYTIQILATNESEEHERSLEGFLQGWHGSEELNKVYVYRTRIGDKVWFGVLFDEFPSFSEAQTALQGLPDDVQRFKPFIRNVRDIGVDTG